MICPSLSPPAGGTERSGRAILAKARGLATTCGAQERFLAGETADHREPRREQTDKPGDEIARFRLDFVFRPTIARSRDDKRHRRERIEDRNFEVIGGESEMAHSKSLRVGAAARRDLAGRLAR